MGHSEPEDVDVVIVGGGPAGLSAALSLGRARRRVVVVDSGSPRNRFAAHMHGVLGHDGMSPLALLELGRTEASGYGVRFIHGDVERARADDGLIEVDTAAGGIRTRRLLVATGLRDELPAIPGFREQWGRGVVVCPYCDGWEHRHDVIGVVATSPRSVEQAQLLRQWSDRTVYFENVVGAASADDREKLARRGIRVEPGAVDGLRTRVADGEARVTGVEVGGHVIEVGVVFTGPTMRPRDGLLRRLGASTTATELGEWVEVDDDGRTSVAGVWAVGNVVNPRANVSVSLGVGSLVAGALNADLVAADIAALTP
ncbi:NAD(P)/FAD-dependent oxidoreductase [Microbacterium hibisci]|uniref:NAD(P)/FAD-dependent oxidoreductase n=1 Tax=Microbacterium hibisci TaxID=2036000 RepID=UPI0019405B87|nr:NAD(P)/FAD-dependent oxidoreductase [Microbacterium hibisci]